MLLHWYAVHTHPRAELKAMLNLANQGYNVYFPKYLKSRRHARRTDVVTAPLFPGYLFVQLDLERHTWSPIQSTVGVKYLVCQATDPIPVPEKLMQEIRERENDAGYIETRELFIFRKGRIVKFISGPFADQLGRFDRLADRNRAIILLELLGRNLEISTQLETVAAYG